MSWYTILTNLVVFEIDMRTYRQALAYLDQYANYELNRSVQYAPETFNLSRIEQLLDRLGNPHRAFQTVHVAGTKGKGSTCRMIESVLSAAGYRTGLYTSPHLHTFRERIQVGRGRVTSGMGGAISGTGGVTPPLLIGREEVAALADELEPHIVAVPGLTYFEIVTAMGFLYFARQQVEMAVVEVGLGGRLDATNVVTPQVSVITSLSYDHTAWLGNTLAQIAFEKAGILKPGVPAVSAPQQPEALEVIECACAETKSPLTLVGRDWLYAPGRIEQDGQWFARVRPDWYKSFLPQPEFYWIPLLGRHQIVNATVALAVLDLLRSQHLTIRAEAVERGLRDVRWPARMEVLSRQPLVVADGAHNGESAQRLQAALREWFPDRKWTLVFGASADKDLAAMLDALVPVSSRVILTRAHSRRAADVERLSELAAERGAPVEMADSVARSLDLALTDADEQSGVIITGSLFVAAEAEEAWAARVGAAPYETDYE
jgi:dihydrofolate synthase/folylpolyglutamate synthase